MTDNKRIASLDMARGIGMVLVVVGHIEYVNFEVLQGIYVFHMPLFFLISGILIWEKREEQKALKELIGKKWKNLMVPYIMFSLMILCVEAFRLVWKGIDDWNTWWKCVLQTICLQGVSVLWFLPALFISELIFVTLQKKAGKGKTLPGVCILVLLAFVLKNLEQDVYQKQLQSLFTDTLHEILSMLFRNIFCVGFLTIGYYLGRYQGRIRQQTRMELIQIPVYTLLFLGLLPLCKGSELRYMNIENLPAFLICATLGSLVVLNVCRLLSRLPFMVLRAPLEYYGRHSLVVMVTHMELRVLYLSILIATPIYDRWNNHLLFCSVIVLLVFMLEIPIIWLFQMLRQIGSRLKFRRRCRI